MAAWTPCAPSGVSVPIMGVCCSVWCANLTHAEAQTSSHGPERGRQKARGLTSKTRGRAISLRPLVTERESPFWVHMAFEVRE